MVVFPQKSFAQSVSVGIYPPIIQMEMEPPAILNNAITLQNGSDQTITYSIFLMPFKPSGSKNGELEYDKSKLSEYKDFFKGVQVSDKNKVISEIKLGPKQNKELTLRIAVAKGHPPRDYYFSVLFISQEGTGSKENSFVGARAGIATNVLVTLGPKTKSQGHIKEFSLSRFVTRGPVNFTLSLANTSPHYLSIQGNVLVRNIFGQTVGNINLVPANVLANSERFLESENNPDSFSPKLIWNENFLLGIYTADLTVALSEEGPVLKESVTFFAFPLELILGLLAGLILTIGIIRRVKRKQSE